MKKLFAAILLMYLAIDAPAQAGRFDYGDYFYYRNHQYLQTPSILLTGATLKIAEGDTVAAIALVRQAAEANMYDTGFITGRSSFRFISTTKYWKEILAIIEQTRKKYSDPASMQIITSDIDQFWKLYTHIDDAHADQLFMQHYIMNGSAGLRTFFEVRMGLRATNLVTWVRQRKKYYESIRNVSLSIRNYIPGIKAAAIKLKALYPDAIFPPTTFVLAQFNAFGTADGGGGQLIGAEFVCDKNTADTSELGNWEKTNITDSSRLLGIVIHELIHIEQNTAPARTLLERSINEGAADFISTLVLGYHLNTRIHAYGNAHEKELWEKFTRQMNGEDVGEWLYNGVDPARPYPQDLGYYMGYKICEAYYNKTADKKKAVKEILEIRDFKKFLADSGYGK